MYNCSHQRLYYLQQEVISMFGKHSSSQTSEPAQFPQALARVIEDGEKHGVTEEMMVKGMVSVGNLMGQFVKPDSPKEALMKEMWESANDQEKNAVAQMVLKVGRKKLAH
jgi:hypothetical protein